jgi:hypothetical protein
VADGRGDRQGGGPPPPRAGCWAAGRAALRSFIGIRKRGGCQRDAASPAPRAVVVAGLFDGLPFGLVLPAIARWVASASQQGGVQ